MSAHLAIVLAQAEIDLFDELSIAGAVMLTLIGLALHLHQQRHRMSMEERVKDSKLTEEEARRRIRFYGIWAPTVTLIGAALLVLVIFDLSG